MPEQWIGTAVSAFRDGIPSLRAEIERMPVPIYMTDADGWISYFNPACVNFAGRTPVPGQDRWCVTWRLYTEAGEVLRHDDCPMAVAIKQKKAVRGAVAVAERPDGSRILFAPYPTPILDVDGRLLGAINLLIDVTDRRQAAALKAQAERCRRLAQSIGDTRTVSTLTQMAEEYDAKARALSRS